MNLNNLKQIRKNLGIEVSDSLKEIGTKNLKLLCDSLERLDLLITRLENPENALKFDKQLNSKIWKD